MFLLFSTTIPEAGLDVLIPELSRSLEFSMEENLNSFYSVLSSGVFLCSVNRILQTGS